MRNLRKLLLLAVGLIAAMAFVPSAASAQTVELEQEDGGHCPATVTAGSHIPSNTTCSIHAVTEPGTTADLYQHTGLVEVRFSLCQNEFEAAFDENGHGYVYDQTLTPEGGTCGREPCDEAEGSAHPHRNTAWESQIEELGASTEGLETLEVTFCLYGHSGDPTTERTNGTPCHVVLNVTQADHAFEVRTPPDVEGNGGAGCENLGNAIELEGHWITTAPTVEHPGFEVHHLNDQVG